MIDKLKSRKFLVALGAFLFVTITEVFGVKVEEGSWNFLTNIVIAYLAGQGAVDAVSSYAVSRWNKSL